MTSNFELSDEHAWELHKENTAPLERGRNANTLHKRTDDLSSTMRQDQLKSQIALYEKLVSPSEQIHFTQKRTDSSSSDILIHWLSYIKFMQDEYPASTQPIFLLLERCTRALLPLLEYKNDVRFIRVCILYADKTLFPSDIYKYFHKKKVGTETALFWVAWAWVSEKNGEFQFCEKIFMKGLSKKAKPIQMLEKRHKQFQRRMCRHMLNRMDQDSGAPVDEYAQRESLQQLSENGAKYNQRSKRFNDSRMHQQNPQNQQRHFGHHRSNRTGSNENIHSGSGFNIFTETEDRNIGYNLDKENSQSFISTERNILAKESERVKENIRASETALERDTASNLNANDSGYSSVPERRRNPLTGPKFEVFTDDSFENKQPPSNKNQKSRNKRSLQDISKTGKAEKLIKDPLRYMRNSEKLHQVHGSEHIDNKIRQSSKNEQKEKAIRSHESHWDEELCFEEKRAVMGKFQNSSSKQNFNLICENYVDHPGSPMTVEMQDSSIDAIDDVHKIGRRGISERNELGREIPLNLQNNSNEDQMGDCHDSDVLHEVEFKDEPTVNTKFAMRELSVMFSSPKGISTQGSGEKVDDKKPLFSANGANDKISENTFIEKMQRVRNLINSSSELDSSNRKVIKQNDGYAKENSVIPSNNTIQSKFQIYEDDDGNKSLSREDDRSNDGGDTATFSIFNEIASSLSPITDRSKNIENADDHKRFPTRHSNQRSSVRFEKKLPLVSTVQGTDNLRKDNLSARTGTNQKTHSTYLFSKSRDTSNTYFDDKIEDNEDQISCNYLERKDKGESINFSIFNETESSKVEDDDDHAETNLTYFDNGNDNKKDKNEPITFSIFNDIESNLSPVSNKDDTFDEEGLVNTRISPTFDDDKENALKLFQNMALHRCTDQSENKVDNRDKKCVHPNENKFSFNIFCDGDD